MKISLPVSKRVCSSGGSGGTTGRAGAGLPVQSSLATTVRAAIAIGSEPAVSATRACRFSGKRDTPGRPTHNVTRPPGDDSSPEDRHPRRLFHRVRPRLAPASRRRALAAVPCVATPAATGRWRGRRRVARRRRLLLLAIAAASMATASIRGAAMFARKTRLRDVRFLALESAERGVNDDRITALPYENRRGGIRLCTAGQFADRRRKLPANGPALVVRQPEDRCGDRLIRLPEPALGQRQFRPRGRPETDRRAPSRPWRRRSGRGHRGVQSAWKLRAPIRGRDGQVFESRDH